VKRRFLKWSRASGSTRQLVKRILAGRSRQRREDSATRTLRRVGVE
jgi:hypothetical protein